MVNLTPVDYLSGLGGLQNLPNPARDQAQAQALRTTDLQQQAAQLQLQQAQTEQQRQQQFYGDIAALGNDPSPNGIASMIRKYPEFAQQLKQAHEIQDEAKRDSDFRVQAQVYSAAANGKYDLAAQQLQSYVDAEVAAGGQPDPADIAIIDALKSADPTEQKRALSMIGLAVASINPQKFSETFKALGGANEREGSVVGNYLVDKRTGDVMFQAPKTEYRTVKNADGSESLLAIDGGGVSGGTPAGDAPNSALGTGTDIEARVASLVPGAVVTSGKRSPERNSQVGGVPNSFHLTDQARDYVPPEGVSMAELHQTLRNGLPRGYQVINEGDHVHVEPASRGRASSSPGGVRTIYTSAGGKQLKDAPSGYKWTANGALTFIPGGPADPSRKNTNQTGPKLTEQQAKDGFSARRMANASKTFSALEADAGFNPNMSGWGSGITKWTGGLINNEKSRKYEAAKGEWGDALIRLTTGAAATRDELSNVDKTYFPQVGDSPAVVKQKQEARANAMAGAIERAGPGAPQQTPTSGGFRILAVRPK